MESASMDNKLLDCLNDILANANEVKDFIEGMSFEDYASDRKT